MIIYTMERKQGERFARKVQNHIVNYVSFFQNYAVFWMERNYFKKLNMMIKKDTSFIKLIFQQVLLMKLYNITHKC